MVLLTEHKMLLLFIFLGLLSLVFGGGCAPNSIGLQRNSSVCYSFHPGLLQYVAAERACNSFGATLVSLNDKYTNVYIAQLANAFFEKLGNQKFWANGHRFIGSKSFYQWINGNQIQYASTNNETSDNGNSDGCMAVGMETGEWKYEDCFQQLPHICEFVADAGKEIDTEHVDLENYAEQNVEYDSDGLISLKTINIIISANLPIKTSITLVKKLYSENDAINSATHLAPQLSLGSTNSETLTPEPSTATNPTTETIPPSTTTAITTSLPLTTVTDPTTIPTTTTTTSVPSTTTTRSKTCPFFWKYYDITGYCYTAYHYMTWKDAEQKCIAEGAHLASIHSLAEAQWVGELTQNTSSPKYEHQTLIGLQMTLVPVGWKWSDGTPADYLPWGINEPNQPPKTMEYCGQLWSYLPGNSLMKFGDFNNYSCDQVVKNFVCKKLPN